MIISKTPFRISFFGGGTDFPIWYKKNRSKVINVAINKYCYVIVRKLPPFFKFNYRLKYYKTEEVTKISSIKHPVVRESLKLLKYKKNFEMVHTADLPAQSGLGASSSFTVGLLNSLYRLNNLKINKKDLANISIFLEQKKIKEIVGSQDQIVASNGGFNIINFYNDKYNLKKVPFHLKNIQILRKNLLLVFSGFSRSAQQIEKKKIKRHFRNIKFLEEIAKISNKAERAIYESKNIISDFSELLNEHWFYKKKLADEVSNSKINRLISSGLDNGAEGAKLLGAGNGGFIMFLVNETKREKLKRNFSKNLIVPVDFDLKGSEIIYNSENE